MPGKSAKPRGRPFEKGKCPNPGGRGRGVRNRSTLVAEVLLDKYREPLMQKSVDLALGGDGMLLRFWLDRMVPPVREHLVRFEMPTLRTAEDALRAHAAVVAAVAVGEITIGEAAEFTKLVESFTKLVEAADLEQRVKDLEAREYAQKFKTKN
jgi:hypothetical protein